MHVRNSVLIIQNKVILASTVHVGILTTTAFWYITVMLQCV